MEINWTYKLNEAKSLQKTLLCTGKENCRSNVINIKLLLSKLENNIISSDINPTLSDYINNCKELNTDMFLSHL